MAVLEVAECPDRCIPLLRLVQQNLILHVFEQVDLRPGGNLPRQIFGHVSVERNVGITPPIKYSNV